MKSRIGILLVTRNNSGMLKEWSETYNYNCVEILNLDESSIKEEKSNIKAICRQKNIWYFDTDGGGLGRNLKQAINFFQSKNIDWILSLHHDAYPLSENFFENLNNYLSDSKLDDFGVIGFNVFNHENDLKHWKGEGSPLRTTARCPLELGDGWYRVRETSRINYNNSIKKPFPVESVMWSSALIYANQFERHIKIDDRFVFFHAWDDIAFQFLKKNIYNIVLPQFHFAHDQRLKLSHNLPVSSPQGDPNRRQELYGRSNHLDIWRKKWGFRYDVNKKKVSGVNLQNYYIRKIINTFVEKGETYLETVTRHDFKKIRKRYEGTLLDLFYNHDPINGPLKFFDI